MPFDQLDYAYTPSRDVAADMRWFTDVLGGRLVFAIEGMGARVAMIELTDGPPRILLADHLDGDVPILVYRVADLAEAQRELESRGWKRGHTLEIPQGPVCSFRASSGQRLAIYELTRPGVEAGFAGRRDFA
jgi:glyoxalase/bleomycin resistance protein/dioxygenase superfamily protein